MRLFLTIFLLLFVSDAYAVKPDAGCILYLQSISQVQKVEINNGEVVLSVDTNQVFSENAISKWVQVFSATVFSEPKCHVKKVSFIVSIDQSSYYKGKLVYADYKLLEEKRISVAEWVRRVDVQKLATMQSVKSDLAIARKSGNHKQAFELVERLIESEPDSLNAKVIRANILLDQKSYVEAIFHYETILKEDPNNETALFNLALALKNMGRFPESIAYYQKLLPLKTNDEIYLNLADTHLKNNQLPLAKEYLEKVSNHYSNVYLILYSILQRSQGNSSHARATLKQIKHPGEYAAMINYNLVILNIDLKDLAGADENYRLLKERDMVLAKELEFLPLFSSAPTAPKDKQKEPMILDEDVIPLEEGGEEQKLF